MSKQQVIDYYASYGEREWERLSRPEGQLEFAITQDALQRYVPQGARILDLGGGPGRWTVWLAERGYRVTLGDLSPELLEIAGRKIGEYAVAQQVEEVVCVDASDLSHWQDDTFDLVLCLGPFYHITEPERRDTAAQEIHRVLKPGGLVFAAFMHVFGFLQRTLAYQDEWHHLHSQQFIDTLMDSGVFVNDVAGRFNSGYGMMPDKVAPFMQSHGFEKLELLSDSGFAAANADQLAELALQDAEAYERIMQIIITTAGESCNLGSSVHMLYIGRKAVC